MSTSAVLPNSAPCWKQEVSRRVAAHQSRRGISAPKPIAPAPSRHSAGSRAALAAARVAARYAQAPSYSQMFWANLPAAPRAAAVAPPPVLPIASAGPRLWKPEAPQAPASAQPSARPSASRWEPALKPNLEPAWPVAPLSLTASLPVTLPASLQEWESESSRLLCKPDLRFCPPNPAPARAPRPAESVALAAQDEWQRSALVEEDQDDQAIEPIEPALHANLIEFPRELVARRKMRPRRVEDPFAPAGSQLQLSIFEVDPVALPIPSDSAAAAAPQPWPKPEWAAIELEAQPLCEAEPEEAPLPLPALEVAPIARRLTAALVDGALIALAVLAAALGAVANIAHPPAARMVAFSAALALLLAGLIYHAFFLVLDEATPGMRCASLSLCTFDDQIPTRQQLRHRLIALAISVVPVGLGIAWMFFDDEHLSWHDRLSQTYLRQG